MQSSVLNALFKLRDKRPVEVLSTGIDQIDSLTGGLPRGAITEVFGPASSGRTSFLFSTLAYATTGDEICALVDTNDSFDPLSAAAAGLSLQQLLWIRCAANIEHAFKATDLILQGGGFGLVVLDISDVPLKEARRIISSWWYRFRRVVENKPTAFVVLAPDSCVRSCSSLTLELKNKGGIWTTTRQLSSEPQPLSQKAFRISSPSERQQQKLALPTSSVLLKAMNFHVTKRRPLNSHEQECGFKAVQSPMSKVQCPMSNVQSLCS